MIRSSSPLATKGKSKKLNQPREIRELVPDGPECLPLPSECSDDDAIDSEDEESTGAFSQMMEETEEDEEDDEEEEWVPPVAPTPKARASSTSRFSSVSSTEHLAPKTTKTRPSKGRASKLEKEMQEMSLGGGSDSDLSGYLLPPRKARQVTAVDDESESENKKKLLGKKSVVTNDVEQTPIGSKHRQSSTRRQTRSCK